jgi:hypothetical protein
MPRDPELRYHEKTLLDRETDAFVGKQDEPGASDFNRIIVAAQVQYGLEKYMAEAANMNSAQLRDEEHDSARLGAHLEATGKPRPDHCHAHAIVAGKHHNAAVVRALMARLRIRIDEPDNGCWLPRNTAATPHPAFPKAVPHSRIHRYNYFFWLRFRLSNIRQPNVFRKDLQLIGQHLQEGTFPDYVMLKKGEGLPEGGNR